MQVFLFSDASGDFFMRLLDATNLLLFRIISLNENKIFFISFYVYLALYTGFWNFGI